MWGSLVSRCPSRVSISALLTMLRHEMASLCGMEGASSVAGPKYLLTRLTVDLPCHQLTAARLPWGHVESDLLRPGPPDLWTRLLYHSRRRLLRLYLRVENGKLHAGAALLSPDSQTARHDTSTRPEKEAS